MRSLRLRARGRRQKRWRSSNEKILTRSYSTSDSRIWTAATSAGSFAAGIHTPIVLVTVLDSDADAILGLDLGANDYIAKPFRLGVLLARLRAHMRQYELSEDATFTVGHYTFRPAAKLMHHNLRNEEVPLSDKECAILKYLYRAGGIAVSCDTLYDEIWGYSAALITHTLQTHIYRLRQKIEEHPSNPQILISEAGGYRLVR